MNTPLQWGLAGVIGLDPEIVKAVGLEDDAVGRGPLIVIQEFCFRHQCCM